MCVTLSERILGVKRTLNPASVRTRQDYDHAATLRPQPAIEPGMPIVFGSTANRAINGTLGYRLAPTTKVLGRVIRCQATGVRADADAPRWHSLARKDQQCLN